MIRKIHALGLMHKKAIVSAFIAVSASTSKTLKLSTKKYDQVYDLAVIGGGSGGLATAFEASKHGLKTIVIDYVEQSPARTKWGLGGTCVNVGCIPKKLMHQASIHGENIVNANQYGWLLPGGVNARENKQELKKYFSWERLRTSVMNHIKSINWGYVNNIGGDQNMEYLNAIASFLDKDTLICSKNPAVIKEFIKSQELPKDSKEYYKVKAKNFVIATGTRPQYLQIKGSELAITSDDIFFKKTPPGKTLVVGGGYVAVEIAGFLRGIGYDVSLMTRGDYLRSFDQDMVREVLEHLRKKKVNIVETSLPVALEKLPDSRIRAQIQNQKTKQTTSQQFDTILFAVGRKATTHNLNLPKLGIPTDKTSFKIKTNANQVQRTNIDNIYAIGDVVEGLPELTSTATKMGAALGRRIANRVKGIEFSKNKMYTDLTNFPTTVFTPLEYSTCGMSEEKAIKVLGRENVEVYHVRYYALEEQILEKYDEQANSLKDTIYTKAIVDKRGNKIVGLHYAGPNAGQIMQGFAVAMRMGLTKQILDQTIGIHPVAAENITNMTVTKQSGLPYSKTSC